MKIGLIRCMQTEDMCPCTADFKMIRARNPISFACPYANTMKQAIAAKIGENIKIIDYTH